MVNTTAAMRPKEGRAVVGEERVERRLAAILAADVAGASRLIRVDQSDEIMLVARADEVIE